MRLAVFGANGRTGRHVVLQALRAGHDVTAFVRSRAKLAEALGGEKPGVTVVEGDVRDAAAVARAVEGADAVVSCLTPVPKDGMVQTEGTRNIVRAMERAGVRRLVSLTGAGVNAPGDPPRGFGSRAVRKVMELAVPKILGDGQAHAEAIRASDLDYAVVRAPRLTDGPATGRYKSGIMDLGPGASVARQDVAAFMLAEATGGRFHRADPHVTAA